MDLTDSCSRVFYERVARVLPSNFVALGDATMRLNPRFGSVLLLIRSRTSSQRGSEGITKSAVGAATLDGALRSVAAGPLDKTFGRTFFARLAKRTQGLWCAPACASAAPLTPPQGGVQGDGLRRGDDDARERRDARGRRVPAVVQRRARARERQGAHARSGWRGWR